MSEALASYAFVSWLRRGVGTEITRADGDGSHAARASVPITLSFNEGLQASVDLALHGPGEVTGLDPRTVIRTWPRADVSTAEPNYFPVVEFDQADLPWRYTPARANRDGRLRPWLCLIVLRPDEIERHEPAGPDHRLAAVTVKRATALPPLAQSWAWAHAQVSGVEAIDPATTQQLLANEPARIVSRLLCPRRLEARTAYTAFLVPAFERGRRAGLGGAVDDDIDGMAPAWELDDTMIDLPVYYAWRFQTGVAGDFEHLVRLLQARALPPTVGIRAMDVSHPDPASGFPPGAPAPLGLEGALKAPSTVSTDWPQDQAERQLFVERLRELVNRPAQLRSAGAQEQGVTPPLYGRWHAGRDTLEPETPPIWFHELNADPRLRATAGLGTLVVQREQQQLMASAWSQAEGIRAINEELQRAQLSREASAQVVDKHIAAVDDETRLLILGPILGQITASPVTIRAQLRRSPVAEGALDPQLRRLARPLGPLGRRQRRATRARASTWLGRMNSTLLTAAPPPPLPSGMATPPRTLGSVVGGTTPERLATLRRASRWLTIVGVVLLAFALLLFLTGASTLSLFIVPTVGAAALAVAAAMRALHGDAERRIALRDGTLTAEQIATATGRPTFVAAELPPDGRPPVAPTASGEIGQLGDSASAHAFRDATAGMLRQRSTGAADVTPLEPLDMSRVGDALLSAIDPRSTIPASYRSRLVFPPGTEWASEDALEPVRVGPQFPQPMYAALRDLSQEWLLPGLDKVPPNTVSLLLTNQRFVEAYMVGLNHEMARESAWNEFPFTDWRWTYFRQFWDSSGAAGADEGGGISGAQYDIHAIHEWPRGSRLGENTSRDRPVTGDHLVLLVRGELLRRYPNCLVYAAKAMWREAAGERDGARVLAEPAVERHPVFSGTLRPDVSFFGFELSKADVRGDVDRTRDQGWYFIFQEHPTEPRFGLDSAPAHRHEFGGSPAQWRDLSWGHMAADEEALASLIYVDLDAELPDVSAIEPLADEPDTQWARTAADMAYITLQLPARLAVHGSDMLPAD